MEKKIVIELTEDEAFQTEIAVSDREIKRDAQIADTASGIGPMTREKYINDVNSLESALKKIQKARS